MNLYRSKLWFTYGAVGHEKLGRLFLAVVSISSLALALATIWPDRLMPFDLDVAMLALQAAVTASVKKLDTSTFATGLATTASILAGAAVTFIALVREGQTHVIHSEHQPSEEAVWSETESHTAVISSLLSAFLLALVSAIVFAALASMSPTASPTGYWASFFAGAVTLFNSATVIFFALIPLVPSEGRFREHVISTVSLAWVILALFLLFFVLAIPGPGMFSWTMILLALSALHAQVFYEHGWKRKSRGFARYSRRLQEWRESASALMIASGAVAAVLCVLTLLGDSMGGKTSLLMLLATFPVLLAISKAAKLWKPLVVATLVWSSAWVFAASSIAGGVAGPFAVVFVFVGLWSFSLFAFQVSVEGTRKLDRADTRQPAPGSPA